MSIIKYLKESLTEESGDYGRAIAQILGHRPQQVGPSSDWVNNAWKVYDEDDGGVIIFQEDDGEFSVIRYEENDEGKTTDELFTGDFKEVLQYVKKGFHRGVADTKSEPTDDEIAIFDKIIQDDPESDPDGVHYSDFIKSYGYDAFKKFLKGVDPE